MTPYPAVFDAAPPERFQRLQLVLPVLVVAVLGLIGERKGPTYEGFYGIVRGGDEWQHPNTMAWTVGN